MFVAVTVLRREGVKLTPAAIKAQVPTLGYLHAESDAHLLRVNLLAGKTVGIGYRLPMLYEARIESVTPGGRMLIYGTEILDYPRHNERYPQAWSVTSAAEPPT